jgi:hypothetical protein
MPARGTPVEHPLAYGLWTLAQDGVGPIVKQFPDLGKANRQTGPRCCCPTLRTCNPDHVPGDVIGPLGARLPQRADRHLVHILQLRLFHVSDARGRHGRDVEYSLQRPFTVDRRHAGHGLLGSHWGDLGDPSLSLPERKLRRLSRLEPRDFGYRLPLADEHNRWARANQGAIPVLRSPILLELSPLRRHATREIQSGEPAEPQFEPLDVLSDGQLQLHA